MTVRARCIGDSRGVAIIVLRFTAMCRYLQREEKRRAVDRGRVSERRAMCDDGDDYKAREGETGSLLAESSGLHRRATNGRARRRLRATRLGSLEAATKRMCVDSRPPNGVRDALLDRCDESWRIAFDFTARVGVFIERLAPFRRRPTGRKQGGGDIRR